ncbi:hypothetical protein E3N88_23539 [Mikania micrantha]|uniref:Uncharacterized protein n=1 Tax=Mikania micrantha TaxID=192012 RepID=A0A5N6NG81_9ASTR|nr:hypothetical protein E3N88_23539 [Mikania micrantha]
MVNVGENRARNGVTDCPETRNEDKIEKWTNLDALPNPHGTPHLAVWRGAMRPVSADRKNGLHAELRLNRNMSSEIINNINYLMTIKAMSLTLDVQKDSIRYYCEVRKEGKEEKLAECAKAQEMIFQRHRPRSSRKCDNEVLAVVGQNLSTAIETQIPPFSDFTTFHACSCSDFTTQIRLAFAVGFHLLNRLPGIRVQKSYVAGIILWKKLETIQVFALIKVDGCMDEAQENGHASDQNASLDLDYYSTVDELIELGPEKLKEFVAFVTNFPFFYMVGIGCTRIKNRRYCSTTCRKAFSYKGISGILKDILSGSSLVATMSVSPALSRPPEQIFEIVNLANELLLPLPNGTITLPTSSNVFVK